MFYGTEYQVPDARLPDGRLDHALIAALEDEGRCGCPESEILRVLLVVNAWLDKDQIRRLVAALSREEE